MRLLFLFLPAVFLSAYLLFQVQPIIARYILPWYGGSPAVWTACMLFFQTGLLGGYAYAHVLVSSLRQRRRWQAGIHLALLAVTLILLPITPEESLKPTGSGDDGVSAILRLLAITVGMPYLVLSASGPLIQHWFAEATHGRSPFRLYSLSNLGSLLGLLVYPFVIEPQLGVRAQTWMWSGAFAVYALLMLGCTITFVRQARSSGEVESGSESVRAPRPAPRLWILWVSLTACGSMLLLSTTSQMTQDVAVVPFLWVLPLALYLATFIISFDHTRWYHRLVWIPLTVAAVAALVTLLNRDFAGDELHLAWQILIYTAAMFCGCMICHGELVRRKPDPTYLTSFYLAVALGGALGGAFVSLLAPRIFNGFWEMHLSLVLLMVLTTICVVPELARSRRYPFLLGATAIVWIEAAIALGFFLHMHIRDHLQASTKSQRGFYGTLRVAEGWNDDGDYYNTLYHGRISHGTEYFSGPLVDQPLSYYTEESGPGLVFQHHPNRTGGEIRPMNIGVVGLGVGTLAAYAEPGDSVCFYEINPQVEALARSEFNYLKNCKGSASVVLGDARVSLARELENAASRQFDALFIDAFSGDSIPIHLLTRESFQLYFAHLAPGGVLAVHVSNLHLDLTDPVRVLADEFAREAVLAVFTREESHEQSSDWILISRDGPFLEALRREDLTTEWARERPREILWTDDFSNLAAVVHGPWVDWFYPAPPVPEVFEAKP